MKYYFSVLIVIIPFYSAFSLQKFEAVNQSDSILVLNGDSLTYFYNHWQPHLYGSIELSNNPDSFLESLSIEAGIIYRNRLIIGAFASSLQSDIPRKLIFPNDFNLSYSHGGFVIGYRTDRKDMFDFKITNRVGFGEMAWQRVGSEEYLTSDRFVTINPSLGVDVNLGRHFRLGGELGYRKMTDLELAGVSEADFDGITIRIGLSVGLFNFVER